MFRIRTFLLLFLTTQIFGALGALTWKTFDISSLLVEEAANVKYQDVNGNTKNLEVILKENGANNIKIRIWVNPSNGIYNLDYAVKVGLRAKNAGLSVTLNLHYSDTWADPGHQTTPSAWSSYTITQLAAAVKSYTTNVLNTFASNGINVNLISIGNEIRAGLLWPLGSYSNFANIGTLLTAGAQGVRASSLSSALIMIHLDEGYSWDTQKWFYDSLAASGTFSMSSFDVQGVSYYPFWSTSSTIANFQTAVNNMATTYKKKIIVMETDWPVSCSTTTNFPSSLLSAYPFSAAGQVSWVKAIAAVVNAIPNSLGVGVMYWEPGWIDNASLGSSCSDNVLFTGDWSGYPSNVIAKARSSVNMMSQI